MYFKDGASYDGPNGSLFISIQTYNSEFWIPNSEIRTNGTISQFQILNSKFRISNSEIRNSEFGIVK